VEHPNELYFKLVQNALFVDRAGNPPAALVLLEEALRIDPRHSLALSVKKRIESGLLDWMSKQRVRTVSKAADDALQCERSGDLEGARRLAEGVLSMDPAHAGARAILERLAQRECA
jgi:hypothetical protein